MWQESQIHSLKKVRPTSDTLRLLRSRIVMPKHMMENIIDIFVNENHFSLLYGKSPLSVAILTLVVVS